MFENGLAEQTLSTPGFLQYLVPKLFLFFLTMNFLRPSLCNETLLECQWC